MSMPLPLDSDGFLRRDCPSCEREFKWYPTPKEEQGTPAREGGYFCPYCAVQAPEGSWWTKAQIASAEYQVYDTVVRPELDKLADATNGVSGGFVDVSIERNDPQKPPALTESNDMRRVDFDCHPSEPVKVVDEWKEPAHCLVCGTTATQPDR